MRYFLANLIWKFLMADLMVLKCGIRVVGVVFKRFLSHDTLNKKLENLTVWKGKFRHFGKGKF
jgi:hypothetical protein